MDKSFLREKYNKIRDEITKEKMEELSLRAFCNLKQNPMYKEAKTVFSFISFRSEISTLPVLEDVIKNKILLVPKVDYEKRLMYPVQINSLNELKVGTYGILEPKSASPFLEKIDLTIVPGLCFDRRGYRVGYGGGYYDKFLSSINTYKIGYCFSVQIEEKIQNSQFDIAVDEVVTD